MKISSPAQLAMRLDRSLSWRKKELTQLKLFIDSCQTSQLADILRRSGIALMYAHWEGFVKDASKYYLKYIACNPIDLGTLKSCFVAATLHGEICSSGHARSNSSHTRLVDLLRSINSPPSKMRRIPTRRVVSTRSNLKGAVLREITATLGLDYSLFELKETPVINRLVTFRNTIAHGGGLPILEDDYNALHAEIIALMDIYRDLVQDAADNDSHLR
jgi:hypothetical protein